MDLNSVLNWMIPTLIIMFFIGIFYVKLKEPTDALLIFIGKKIRDLFLMGREVSESVIVEDVITY